MNFSVDGVLEGVQSRMQTLAASRFFAPAVNGVALLILAAGMAGWTWKLIRPPTAATPAATMQGAAPQQAPAFDVQALLSANLFGEAAPAAGGDPMNAPVSSLNLVLTGIIAAGGESYALISVNGAAQEPFAIGDEVTAGAVLDAVYSDRVILVRGGVSESLILEGMPPPIDVAAPAPPQTQAPVSGGEKYADIIRNTPNQFYVPRNLITEQLKKPQELLTQAMMVPNADGGYLVREVQPGGAFEKLGLQVGDVVRAVNGQPLNSVNDAMRMYQQLRFLRAVRVDVTRGGQPETLQYNIN
jgi:general secretion pathway protein C